MAMSGAIRAGKAFVEFAADTNLLYRGMDDIKRKLTAFGSFFAKSGAGMAAIGASITGPLGKIFTDAAERGRSIGDLATQFGMTTQSISQLAGGFEAAGIGLDQFTGSMSSLMSRMLDGDQIFSDINLNGRALARLPLDKSLERIANEFAKGTDKAQKWQLAVDLFGESLAGRIIPYLNEGAAGIRRLREEGKDAIVDPDTVARSNAALTAFSQIWQQVRLSVLDVGSALLPTKEELRGMVDWVRLISSQVREWIAANKQTIQIVFAVGLALGVVGTAMGLFGAAAITAGLAVGGLVIVVKGLFAVLAAVFSPAGLIVAGVVAIGIGIGYLAAKTETGAAAIGGIKAGFADLAETATTAWGGITAAFQKGDLAGAANIAFLAVSVYWRKFVLGITQGWNAFKDFFVDGWFDLSAAISKMMLDLGAFILRNLLGPLQKVLNTVADVVDVVDSDQANKIRGALGGGMSDEEINRARDEAKADIDRGRDARKAEGKATRETSEAEARSDLAKIIDELHTAVAEAKGGGEYGGGGSFDDEIEKKVPSSQMQGLYQRIKGTFSTPAAAQQLGIGDNIAKRQLDGINQMAQNSKELPEIKKGIAELGTAWRFR